MAFIDDEMAIIGDEVRGLAAAHETLNQRDVNDAGRLAPPAADDANALRIDLEERLQALHPLRKQFPAMNENERISRPVSDQCGGDNRLAKGRRRRQYADVVPRQRIEGFDLLTAQFAFEQRIRREGLAGGSDVFDRDLDAMIGQQLDDVIEAAARQTHVASMQVRRRR